jgi:hypothetical protein
VSADNPPCTRAGWEGLPFARAFANALAPRHLAPSASNGGGSFPLIRAGVHKSNPALLVPLIACAPAAGTRAVTTSAGVLAAWCRLMLLQ